jgi:hypothetical protein
MTTALIILITSLAVIAFVAVLNFSSYEDKADKSRTKNQKYTK